ncbi:MAG: HK97 family phage prohead protease [Treponema sp.]|nr:HK97 family phage prohead protease [Treponema sp.]
MNKDELLRRSVPCGQGMIEEIRAEDGAPSYRLKGTAIVYNRETVLYENEAFRWVEIIEAGAARDALLRAEQVLLWNHDAAKPMAARKNNTLTAREDSYGVHIEADAGGTSWGRDGIEAIRAGLVDKMSFGFYLSREGYTEERSVENGKRVYKRVIKKFNRIVDFSPVTYAAYQDTGVSLRDAESIIKEFEDAEQKREETKRKIDELIHEFPEQKIGA